MIGYSSIHSGAPNVVPLHALRTLFALEHNRIASQLAQNDNYSNWTDEQLFMQAREYNIALFQYITYNEYVPTVLAENYNSRANMFYDNSIDATTSNFFCSVGLEYGHPVTPENFAGSRSVEINENNGNEEEKIVYCGKCSIKRNVFSTMFGDTRNWIR